MANPTDATILHADMDAFYASVEQRDRPELRGCPVAVGGRGKRGVVAAASYEARRFGVRSAMPMVKACRLCPELLVVRPRMSVYASISADIREIFYRYTPIVEPLSLDEAYLDVSGSLRLFGSVQAIVDGIRDAVRSELELAVSIGAGPGKLVAKIASDGAKPDGALIIAADRVDSFLRPLPIRAIWGVGKVTEAKLGQLGIATIGDLADADLRELEDEVGSWAPILHGLANGEDLRTVECDRGRKSCGEENTFPEDVDDDELIGSVIIAHAETVARRMRRESVSGRTVTLKYREGGRNAEFNFKTRSRTLDEATDDGAVISRVARELWQRENRGQAIRLIGVQVSGLEGERPTQLGLFSAPEDDRRRALNAALDEIVDRFGAGTIRRGK